MKDKREKKKIKQEKRKGNPAKKEEEIKAINEE